MKDSASSRTVRQRNVGSILTTILLFSSCIVMYCMQILILMTRTFQLYIDTERAYLVIQYIFNKHLHVPASLMLQNTKVVYRTHCIKYPLYNITLMLRYRIPTCLQACMCLLRYRCYTRIFCS